MGRRATGNIPDAVRRSAYQDMLVNELGRTRQLSSPKDNGCPEGTLDFLTRPISLLILGSLFFAVTFAVLQWRDGAFDDFLAPKSAVIGKGSKSWLLGRSAGGRVEETAPDEQAVAEFEASITPAPQAKAAEEPLTNPVAEAPAVEAGAAE